MYARVREHLTLVLISMLNHVSYFRNVTLYIYSVLHSPIQFHLSTTVFSEVKRCKTVGNQAIHVDHLQTRLRPLSNVLLEVLFECFEGHRPVFHSHYRRPNTPLGVRQFDLSVGDRSIASATGGGGGGRGVPNTMRIGNTIRTHTRYLVSYQRHIYSTIIIKIRGMYSNKSVPSLFYHRCKKRPSNCIAAPSNMPVQLQRRYVYEVCLYALLSIGDL